MLHLSTVFNDMGKSFDTKKLSLKLSALTLSGIVLITGYLVVTTYRNQISTSERMVLNQLQTITHQLADQINGEQHQYLTRAYPFKDAIASSMQNDTYLEIHNILKEAKVKNHLETDIYTLFLEKGDTSAFYFGVTSGDNPYFRHAYPSFPSELLNNYTEGGMLPLFEDEHGSWLSAFSPILNAKGEVIAIVEADKKFDTFIDAANGEAISTVVLSLAFVSVIGFLLLYSGRTIIQKDGNQKAQILQKAYDQMARQNKQIKESISYASNIQKSLIPDQNQLRLQFPDSFIYYKAKDIVSGDFPWHYQKGEYNYWAAVDCTGHGVPGAMMSFVGYFLLKAINKESRHLSPAEVLNQLHQEVRKTLKQDTQTIHANDGMDIGLCCLNMNTGLLEFSGAHRPLYVLKQKELVQLKGDRKCIGGKPLKKELPSFTNHTIQLEDRDAVFVFSDGLTDQFGGPNNKKYSSSRIKKLLLEMRGKPMQEVKKSIEKDFTQWMNSQDQIDDVLLIGVQV